MAEHLASIFGTEKDRVNCPFYFKIGSCRHGDRCSRLHNRPNSSVTLLFSNMYQSPDAGLLQTGGIDTDGNIRQMDPKKMQEHFEDFYEDIFEELSKYGEIENLNVCENLADHMIGNVYVKFREEEYASAALHAMTGRFYAGRPIVVEFSPVTDFRESTCRQHEENMCNRGGYCNFMHLRKISRDLRRKLFGGYKRSRSRSYSPYGRGDARGDERRGGDYYDGGRRGGRGGPGGGFRGRGPGRGYGGRGRDYRDDRRGYDDRYGGGGGGRRDRSRSYSPDGRRGAPGAREGSAERRAKIEAWNREREGPDSANGPPGVPPGVDQYQGGYR
eukprot:TRINITY_DN4563_c1_g1_i1.p1 TRINITY_DN4563_c1_g1~~TRINITY_DN4563_c1_g1_i1.p1  ORF type:complete len:330 (+),score=28.10 TRINITY_DN4563_c1_g1_i1:202-1191(+)